MYNFYKLLNIPFGSNIETVKQASNKMLAQWYATPQKKSSINELETAIYQALTILGDPFKKEVYDRALLQLELQSNQKEAYRKYGTSSRNKFINKPHKAPTNHKNKPALPTLKKNIYRWLAIFGAVWVGMAIICFSQLTSGKMVMLVFLSIGIAAVAFNLCKAIYNYVEVRQIVHTKLTARRATVFSINFFFLLFPILFFNVLNKINKLAAAESNVHQYAYIDDCYGSFVNVSFKYKGKNYHTSLKYNDFYTYDLLEPNKYSLHLPIHIQKNAPFICHWCNNKSFFFKANYQIFK